MILETSLGDVYSVGLAVFTSATLEVAQFVGDFAPSCELLDSSFQEHSFNFAWQSSFKDVKSSDDPVDVGDEFGNPATANTAPSPPCPLNSTNNYM